MKNSFLNAPKMLKMEMEKGFETRENGGEKMDENAGEEILDNANKARIEIKAIVEQCQREVEKVLEKYNDSCLLMKDYGNGEWGVGDTVIANYEIVPVSQFPVHCYAELEEVIRSAKIYSSDILIIDPERRQKTPNRDTTQYFYS